MLAKLKDAAIPTVVILAVCLKAGVIGGGKNTPAFLLPG